MLDHLLGGRFILGISPGALPSDAEILGNYDLDRPAMFLEAINHVLALWQGEPPYDLRGRLWNISTGRTFLPETGMGTIPKPLQRPHPPSTRSRESMWRRGYGLPSAASPSGARTITRSRRCRFLREPYSPCING